MRRISMATRDELVAVVAERYARSARKDRSRILDEFTAVSGLHRKHAMRLLRCKVRGEPCGPRLSSTFRLSFLDAHISAQKMASAAMKRRAWSSGRTVRPNGPVDDQRSVCSDQ